jgi:hypothetical protein
MQTRALGRPPKFSTGDRFEGKETGPADFRERLGTVVVQGPGSGEYTVRFDDNPTVVSCVQSNWMESIPQPATR